MQKYVLNTLNNKKSLEFSKVLCLVVPVYIPGNISGACNICVTLHTLYTKNK